MSQFEKPDKSKSLSRLRPFQKRTVDHVVTRLFDHQGSQRFLVADEVGLGKTLVASGVIAEFVERAWESTERIDILYMCSNRALAEENLPKLRVGGSDQGNVIPATRFTLLPSKLHEFHPKLNFISVTPATAVNISGWGHADERVVLYKLLRQRFDGMGVVNFLQGNKNTERWRVEAEQGHEPDASIAGQFHARIAADRTLLNQLEEMREAFARRNAVSAQEYQTDACRLTGTLRTLLAKVCIDSVQPDLIILDEFQRFKDLLVTGNEDEISPQAELAQQLFDYRTPEGNNVAMLLLSATPYCLFSTSDEASTESHYDDFRQTMRFLLNDEAKYAQLDATLKEYGQCLHAPALSDGRDVERVRDALQSQLLTVMSRHERVTSTQERDAMVEEVVIRTAIGAEDVQHFLAAEDFRQALDARDLVELWKSAPYLYNFGKGYEFKRTFEERHTEPKVRQLFEQVCEHLLNPEQIEAYASIAPANGRLRALIEHTTGNQQWKMLWVPPSRPYWPLEGAWAANRHFTKTLIFSSWNVVPDAISALLSYHVEGLMVAAGAREKGIAYRDFARQRGPLLRFNGGQGAAASMTTFALGYPCLRLARLHPLEFQSQGDVQAAMLEQVSRLMEELRPLAHGERSDPRWYWAAPLLLDAAVDREPLWKHLERLKPTSRSTEEGEDEHADDGADELGDEAGPSALARHVAVAREVTAGNVDLGSFPDDLNGVLVELALGGPATLWARALLGLRTVLGGVSDRACQVQAAQFAMAARTLFNEPHVIEMLQDARSDAYWRSTLRYAIHGNLQAVLDEYAHLLWEPATWSETCADDSAQKVTQAAAAALSTRTSTIAPDYYTTGKTRVLKREDGPRIRTNFALRYGSARSTGEQAEHREVNVRDAFKSPFYPFVLVSTSVGQEGLDFHPWCHSIWHWNLPGNPVDLEQREGRVHRYKGHAIRKNVAHVYGDAVHDVWRPGRDPWSVIFEAAEAAARDAGRSELEPCWLSPGEHKVQRCIPLLPLSREHEQLGRLKRSLAIYRLVFGQPRQEELVELLHHGNLTLEQIERWTVRLAVPDSCTEQILTDSQSPS